jgi:hypothetical protein
LNKGTKLNDSKRLQVIDQGEDKLKKLIDTRLRPLGTPKDITELVKRAGDHEESTYQDLQEASQNNAQRMMDLLPEEVRKELIQEHIRKALAK